VRYFRRTAQRDTTLGGQRIAEGDKVVIWYASANRDESVFVDPDRFDVGRTPNDHVAFGGGGPHFCLGASLARLEARVTFEEVVAQVGEVALAGPVAPLRSTLVNGIKHLPVRVSRRPAPARVPR
jgi:cytochrome P450